MNLFRNGEFIGNIENTGSYTDHPRTERPVYAYKVCEVGTLVCSEEVVVSYLPEEAGGVR